MASDCFHSATCPEQALLKWAGHPVNVFIHSAHSHAAGADVDCCSCALAAVALVLVTIGAQILRLLHFSLADEDSIRAKLSFSPSLAIARGPPVLV